MAKRTRLNRPYPTQPLQDALPIAQKIQDANGGNPVETDMLAEAMGTSVKSSQFMQRLKSSAMYGLTIGAHTDEMIELTALGERLTAPGSPEEEAESRRQAALAPEVFRKFYAAYAGKTMPGDMYAANTLTRQLGVDERLAEECLGIVRRNGLFAGVIEDRAGTLVVARTEREAGSAVNDPEPPPAAFPEPHPRENEESPPLSAPANSERRGHSGNEGIGDDDVRIANPPRTQILLVAAEPDDPAGEAALAVARGLGVEAESAALDANGAELVSGDLLAALESARGCVFVFPQTAAEFSDGEPVGDSVRRSARAWASLGAALGRLGNRIVVVHPADLNGVASSPSFQDLAGESVASVERAEGAALFAALAPALIQSGVIRVSVG